MTKPSILQRAIGLVILFISFVGGWVAYDYQFSLQSKIQLPKEGALFEIAQGSSMQKVTEQLHAQGILKKPLYLLFYARKQGLGDKIKAGEYRLTADLTYLSMLDLFVQGKVVEYNLTIVEGWNIHQVLQALAAEKQLVNSLAQIPISEVMQKVTGIARHPEGQFLPDTYQFTKGTSDIHFLKRAFSMKEKVLAQEWKLRAPNLPLQKPYEALILASIIEKETAQQDEYAKVAGVFVRRLQKGMLLQTDPTVIYGMGVDYKGNIRRKDLEQDTAYNTYVHAGLPPTPIAMPGRQAIHAALHPDDSNALYFVATGDGGHYFSATLDEHLRAVRQYQLKRK